MACLLEITLAFMLFVLPAGCASGKKHPPHIIFILADDMGWNDVGFHGSDQIPTPNIDALAYKGVILNQHYVQAICTPSRTALMTARYPIRTGMQGQPITAAEPRGLPPGKILPQYLKDLGYSNHIVGKWHLGYHLKEMTPTYRGFDSHVGYWNGFIGYYDHIMQVPYPNSSKMMNGYDMRRNMSVAHDLAGKYATDIFTEEAVRVINEHDQNKPLFLYLAHLAVHGSNAGTILEAPQDVVNKFMHISDPNRRVYAAMMSKMDDGIGKVVDALQKSGMLENSIIVFSADNGAPTKGIYPNWGSNYPLRGLKETVWEGGVRSAALIWSPLLKQTPRVSTQLMHITDWLPTLYAAAGGDTKKLDRSLDGINMWDALVSGSPSPRKEILINIDELEATAAYRFNRWKLVIGSMDNGTKDGYFGESGHEDLHPPPAFDPATVSGSPAGLALAAVSEGPTPASTMLRMRTEATIHCPEDRVSTCNPKGPRDACLFDLEKDPCETVAVSNRKVLDDLTRRLLRARNPFVFQRNKGPDVTADPWLWNNTWIPWTDCQTNGAASYCLA